jgi:hypothetical protein
LNVSLRAIPLHFEQSEQPQKTAVLRGFSVVRPEFFDSQSSVVPARIGHGP